MRRTAANDVVLGTDKAAALSWRSDSGWDWMQSYELRTFEVAARHAGQPEVAWQATIRRLLSNPSRVLAFCAWM